MKKVLILLLFTVGKFATQGQDTLNPQTQVDSAADNMSSLQTPMQLLTRQPETSSDTEAASIQREHDNAHEDEVLCIGATIFVMVIVMVFLVVMPRTLMDNHLRHKILNNNVQVESLGVLLDIAPQDRKVSNLR